MKSAIAWVAGLAALATTAVAAQDLQGRDTAGNWRVTHHSIHGIWNTICDEREESTGLKKRCYVRWVDVYAEAPKFGALFVFITPRDDGHDVEFGPEVGTAFRRNGFRVEGGSDVIWQMERVDCLLWANCQLTASESKAILDGMGKGISLAFEFSDRHGRAFELNWSLDGFTSAFDEYEAQWLQRQR